MTTLTAAMNQLIFGDIQLNLEQLKDLMAVNWLAIGFGIPAPDGAAFIGQTEDDRVSCFQYAQRSSVSCVAWLSTSRICATRDFNFCRLALV